MRDHDLIDWVEGEPSLERMYILWTILVLALSLVFAVLAVYSFSVGFALFPARIWFLSAISAATGGEVFVSLMAIVPLTDLVVRRWILRHRPGCLRVGISRQGLAIRPMLRTVVFPWRDVRWTDATHIELSRKSDRVRLALTAGQTAAIIRFHQAPLNSSRPA